jgi:hypothetical protein
MNSLSKFQKLDPLIIFQRENPELLKLELLPEQKMSICGVNILVKSHEGVPLREDLEHKINRFKVDFDFPHLIFEPERDYLPYINFEVAPGDPIVESEKVGDIYHFRGGVGEVFYNLKDKTVKTVYTNTFEELFGHIRIVLAHYMVLNEIGGLFHGSGVKRNDESVVFLGRSGAGKTTSVITSPGNILSDEIVGLTYDSKGFKLWSTPFGGDTIPLNDFSFNPSICFINKSDKNELITLSKVEFFKRFFHSLIMLPVDEEITAKGLDFLEEILKKLKVYLLNAKKDGSFWKDCFGWEI